ncbi:MAG: hypothetical protein Q7U30_00775 [Methylicorpusculum sp.]|nr:hypothetical protein [Methylicorpusculum sp.]
MTILHGIQKLDNFCCFAGRQFETFCLLFKTVSLDFSGFQGCQNAKTVDITITPSELITHCSLYSSPQSRHSRPAVNGRVEQKKKQGCLPKSCHSLDLGMKNFASILGGRLWPFG